MQKHKIFHFLPYLFILITIGNFFYHLYNYRADIFAPFNGSYWHTRYEESQWVVPNSKNPVGDDGLYAYVGYAYMQGQDPSLLNAQLPPFGKYLVGLFEITTNSMGGFSLFFTGLSLILLFLFTKLTTKSLLIASATTLLFSFDPLVIEQMRAPYLDTLYLCLLLFSFLFLFLKKPILSGISLGLFMSVKSPFLAGVVIVVYAAWLLLQKKAWIKDTSIIVLSAAVVYIATYARTFLLGHNLLYFLKVQKYLIHFYSIGAKGVIGAVFPMLLYGKWPTWFGPTLSVTEWTIMWLLGSIGVLIALLLFLKGKKSSWILFHLLWIGGYMAFLIITPIFPRYLLLLLPFMYNLLIWSLLKGISLKFSWVLPLSSSTSSSD